MDRSGASGHHERRRTSSEDGKSRPKKTRSLPSGMIRAGACRYRGRAGDVLGIEMLSGTSPRASTHRRRCAAAAHPGPAKFHGRDGIGT
jgi:hypothetical protein